MLSLRQVKSVDVSSSRADPHARSKEFSLLSPFSRDTSIFSIIFRLAVVIAGLSLCLFGTQLAIAQLFSASLLYLPTQNWVALNSLLVILPAFICSVFSGAVGKRFSPKKQIIIAGLALSLVVSFAALALRVDYQPSTVIVVSVLLLALFGCAFMKVVAEMVPVLPAIKTFNGCNSYFFTLALCSVLAAVALVREISFSLPGALEIAASFILLGCAMVFKAMPADLHSERGMDEPVLPQATKLKLVSVQDLLPFLVPAYMTAIPVATVLLLTMEQNWALFPHLMHILQMLCQGALVGSIIAFLVVSGRFQVSQFSVPALTTFALAFVMAVSPAANQGINVDTCLVVLGGLFVYSNVQLLTRAQNLLNPVLLGQLTRLLIMCTLCTLGFFVLPLQPFLDTISATMLVRFLGLEVVAAGSVALGALFTCNHRLVNSLNIKELTHVNVEVNVETAHDF